MELSGSAVCTVCISLTTAYLLRPNRLLPVLLYLLVAALVFFAMLLEPREEVVVLVNLGADPLLFASDAIDMCRLLLWVFIDCGYM